MQKRIMAVPSTEQPSAAGSARGRLSDEYLDAAFEVVDKTLKSPDEALRWKAAQWVMEMQMGKPKQEIDTSSNAEKELATQLSAALTQWTAERALPPVVEDGVYTLGEVLEAEFTDITDTPISSPSEPAQAHLSDPVPVTPVKATVVGRQWDALPE